MKSNKLIKQSGPYEVHSISQDGEGVRLVIYPAFPQYNLSEEGQKKKTTDPSWAKEPRWAIHRLKDEGGGPSIFTAMALAEAFEEFLNQSYSEGEVTAWKQTLDKALEKVRQRAKKRFEKVMAKLERRSEEQ